MAHLLEIVDGQAQMAYRETAGRPWHGLGVPVRDNTSPADMMVMAGLDWTVSKVETHINIPVLSEDGITEEMKWVPTGTHALIRDTDKRILTEVGAKWNPCQNHEAFAFFNEFVEAGDMMMDTAGSLKDGQIVWALADLKDGFELFGGDEVKGYLLFTNPHEYGKTIEVRFCAERVVCHNTLTMALNETGFPSVRINHRAQFDSEAVKRTLGLSHHKLQRLKEQAEYLGSKKYDRATLVKYFGSIFGEPTNKDQEITPTVEKLMGLVEKQPGIEFAPGTYWQMFNAVTYATDHVFGNSVDTRLTSAWFGPNAKKKLEALNLAVELAGSA